jgi:hypothetical protein
VKSVRKIHVKVAFPIDFVVKKPSYAPPTSGVMRKVRALYERPCLRILIYIFRDHALEIYRNASIEKVAYIRHLMQRAEKEDEMRTLWQSLLLVRQPSSLCCFLSNSANLHKDLQSSINRLHASPALADKIYVDIAAKVLHELQQVKFALVLFE